MPEFDYTTSGEVDDPLLGVVRYSITRTIHAVCPNCGNPDCAEIEEFKQRLKVRTKPSRLPSPPDKARVMKFLFENDDGYRAARDISLDLLEKRGWKPEPELRMLIEACDVEGLKQELEKRGVAYAEEPWP